MKNFILLSFFLILSSCKKEAEEIFYAPKLDDINKVIETLIHQDSLPIFKKDTSSKSISLQLNKLKVKVMPTINKGDLIAPEEPSENYVYVQELLYSSEKSPAYFVKSDSTYLLYQNEVHKLLEIDSVFSEKLKLISLSELQADKYGFEKSYYSISIPIFSKDRNIAYVEWNYYAGDYGTGFGIILKKEKGIWKMLKRRRTWIS